MSIRPRTALKVANVAITLRDGDERELESADAGGVQGLAQSIDSRIAR